MKKDLCIVIPIYKEKLEVAEKVSLYQLFYLVGQQYDTYFICPDNNIDTTEVSTILPYAKKETFCQDYFNDGVEGYNRLCMSSAFYERFINHEYMFTYHTDSIILYNNINKYLAMGYDYYGAPLKHMENEALCGGFSFKRIDKCIKLCKFFEQPDFNINFYKRSGFKNEDIFFSICLPKLLPYHLAAAFSWSRYLAYKEKLIITNGRLPMGIHGIKNTNDIKPIKKFIRKEVVEKYGLEQL